MIKIHNCIHREFCGGCAYQGVPYNEQLKVKEKQVHDLFNQAGIEPAFFHEIEGLPPKYRQAYRNKMEYSFGDEVKDGPLCLGMHERGRFMSVFTVDHCLLVSDDFNKILRKTLDFSVEKGYSKYNKKTHEGLLRNLILRRGVRTGELIAIIVTSSQGYFDGEGWMDSLLKLELDDDLVGIMHAVYDGKGDKAGCDNLKVIHGRDYYNEEMNGLHFRVNIFSFFQTNIYGAERLYDHAVSLIPDINGKLVFDIYCGTGTISQIAAKKASNVIGIELNEDSIAAARENTKFNAIENCEFRQGDALKIMQKSPEKPDVIIVDPPRAGMTDKAVSEASTRGAETIVYISCNPKTLVKNLGTFRSCGYNIQSVKPFDNFPYTTHVECVTLMSRTK